MSLIHYLILHRVTFLFLVLGLSFRSMASLFIFVLLFRSNEDTSSAVLSHSSHLISNTSITT
jgi:hypothetical protein